MLPTRYLNSVSRFSRLLWRKVDEFRFAHKDGWDGRVFMPLHAWREILAKDFPEIREEDRNQAMRAFSIAGAWRPGQDIVRFDPDFQGMLRGTRLAGNLPSDCLARLPAWSIYFDAGPMESNGMLAEGFFASLEAGEDGGFLYLRLAFLGERSCQPVLIPLGDWTLERALELAHGLVNRNRAESGLPIEPDAPYADEGLHSALNMILFVCSDAMSHEEAGSFRSPQARKVKKSGWRIFPPAKPSLHVLGRAAGERFRRYMASGKEKSGVAPHLRRAHWHGFWHGPLKGERTFRLRWLSPIPVNMREDEEE